MIDALAEYVGCKCFVVGEGRLNAVWLHESVIGDIDAAPVPTVRTLSRHFKFYAEHGLKVFKPPTYVAYYDEVRGAHRITLGRFKAKRLRAYGFELSVEGWQVYVVSRVLTVKKRNKVDKKDLKIATECGFEIIESVFQYGKT